MELLYLKNNEEILTEQSNEDVDISSFENNHRTTIVIKAKSDIQLVTSKLRYNKSFLEDDEIFLNGYQSWTDTREFSIKDRENNLNARPLLVKSVIKRFEMDKYGDITFYKYARNKLHGYDIFYSKGSNNTFIYSFNYDNAYLVIEIHKSKKYLALVSDIENKILKAGESFTIYDFKYFDDFEQGKKEFDRDFPLLNKEKVFGYTSWYNYYQNINEKIMLSDLSALDSRFNLFQIDDGYEKYVGDWKNIDKEKFPSGLKTIVEKIHEKGFKAGIWLAPFVVEEKSETFALHPDWIKKDVNGDMLKAGGNWSSFYALDLDNQEALAYIEECLRYYIDLGFDFFKLDFLYACALYPYKGRTRCEIQTKAYKFLREILDGKTILGCGANIISSYKNFDYLRIGPDVSLDFDDKFFMRVFHRERVSTKITLQNTIYRSFLNNRLFGCDPDVFLLRDENIKLTNNQKNALTKINALFGNVLMTSDNISSYNEKVKETLSEALNLFYNAKDVTFKKEKSFIRISYNIDGVSHTLKYSTKKGIFV